MGSTTSSRAAKDCPRDRREHRRRLRWAGRVVSFQSTGQSLYNGVTFHQRARILQQLFYTVAYTFARSDDTPQQPIATVFGGMNDRRSLAIQGQTLDTRAPGNNDQHQHLTVSAMYDTTLFVVDRRGLSKRLLRDWELAFVYTYQTGLPYSAFVNGDLNGDRNPFNDLAPETTWNAYRLPIGLRRSTGCAPLPPRRLTPTGRHLGSVQPDEPAELHGRRQHVVLAEWIVARQQPALRRMTAQADAASCSSPPD